MMKLAYFASLATAQECISRWGDVAVPPADPVLGIKAQFVADDTPTKIGLSVGAYRDDDGNPWVLPPVEAARERLFGPNGTTTHEYLSIDGFERYNKLAQGLLYAREANHDVVTVQALSGTGALRLAMEFLNRHYPGPRTAYIPAVTWSNHWNIFRTLAGPTRPYTYLDKAGLRLEWSSLLADLEAAPEGSVVLLHLCAHNPSGVDPSRDQWKELAALVKRRQGLAPWACVSFSKNRALQRRAGAAHATVASPHEADAVRGHLKKVARAMYSNPPAFGARVVAAVLDDPDLKAAWLDTLKVMSSRIGDMRTALRAKLDSLDTGRDWSHITSQIGMFSYTGMTKSEVLKIREKHHVYMLESGRISMAGINTKNVDQLATAIADVLE
ncbi:hypothetical protein JL720_9152 [Aureococcus anophagefferens]|nr:hypothetical protein JL720_9152 [Aureococcus anophagefferens]